MVSPSMTVATPTASPCALAAKTLAAKTKTSRAKTVTRLSRLLFIVTLYLA